MTDDLDTTMSRYRAHEATMEREADALPSIVRGFEAMEAATRSTVDRITYARDLGISWQAIADGCGWDSRQAAQQWYERQNAAIER